MLYGNMLCGVRVVIGAGPCSCGLAGERFLSLTEGARFFVPKVLTFSGVYDGRFWLLPSAKGTAGYLVTDGEMIL